MPTCEHMISIVEAYVNAFERGDAEAIVQLYDENASVEDPIGTPEIRGHDRIRAFYLQSLATGAQLRLDGPVRTVGDLAVFPFHVDLRIDGQAFRIDVIDMFRFGEDGKIIEMRAYWGENNFRPV